MRDKFIFILIGWIAGLLVGCLLTLTKAEVHEIIIEHGCAQYNSTTGEFEWKESKDGQK